MISIIVFFSAVFNGSNNYNLNISANSSTPSSNEVGFLPMLNYEDSHMTSKTQSMQDEIRVTFTARVTQTPDQDAAHAHWMTVEQSIFPPVGPNKDPQGSITNGLAFMVDLFEDTVAGPLFLRRQVAAAGASTTRNTQQVSQQGLSLLKVTALLYF